MAPRSTKAKKTTEVKVAETDAPKKGRGKAKVAVEPEEEEEQVEEIAPIVAKNKRGKKAANDAPKPVNNKSEESAPPAKRGRKKVAQDEPTPTANGDQAVEESAKDEQDEEIVESNGDTEVPSTAGRGRKKQVKKEPVPSEKPSRGRKNKQEESIEKEEVTKDVEEKPKGKGRGRKPQPKAELVEEVIEEEVKEKPVTKGRKKAQPKVPESEEIEQEESEQIDEDKPLEEVKAVKGKRGRKAAVKEDTQDDEKDDSAAKKKKGAKKEDKPKETETKEEDVDEEIPEEKPAKGKRGQKKEEPAAAKEEATGGDEDAAPAPAGGEPATKRRRRPADDDVPEEEPKKKAPPKNKSVTNYEEIDFTNTSKNENSKEWNLKISSWNVDGIRAWAGKGGLDYLKHEKPDILCLQETKCSQDKLPDEVANVPGYHAYWLSGEKEGYAGVAIYTTKLAMNVQYGLQNKDLDDEGRIITAEYEQFYLVCTYVPNAGRKLVTLPKRLQWNEEFRKYIKELDKKKPVIICGDMNVSHNEIDLANPKTNRKNAGFTDEERAGMTELLADGFVDSFRQLYADTKSAYTFWTYMSNSRAKNVGWRLDYFIMSERLVPSLCDNVIRSQVYGSDHCPVTLFLHLTTAEKPKEE